MSHDHSKTYNKWATVQFEVATYLTNLISEDLKSNSFLDAGCGTGIISDILLKKNSKINITGLDFKEKVLSEYSKINKKFIKSNLEEIKNINEQSFNIIISSFCLHWTNLNKSLSQLYKILKDIIYIAIPIKGSLEDLFNPKEKFNYKINKENIIFKDRSEIIQLARKQGFKIKDIQTKSFKIPYSGINLLKYFKYTGTTMPNTYKNAHLWLKSWLKENENKKYNYNILFLKCYK